MLKMGYASLDDVPEKWRGFCSVENGVVTLDDDRLKTQEDVDNVVESKRKEVNDHNATKTKLALWQRLGNSPDEVQERLDDLNSRAGNSTEQSEKLSTIQKERNKLFADNELMKQKLAEIEPEYNNMKSQIRTAKTEKVLKQEIAKIQGVDHDVLFAVLQKDVALGYLELDDSEEQILVKTGKPFTQYAASQVEIFKLKKENTPGKSHPGGQIPNNYKDQRQRSSIGAGYLSQDEKDKLDS